MTADLEAARPAVLARYGSDVSKLRWVSLGAAGGFSGAVIWRGETDVEPVLALKAWPPGAMSETRLAGIHVRMAEAGHLAFVPAVVPATGGATVVSAAGRVWDLTGWMLGAADFDAAPTPARLANACAALAMLHGAWRPAAAAAGPCPGVRVRLRALAKWKALVEPGPDPGRSAHPALVESTRRGRRAAAAAVGRAEAALRAWEGRPVPVQPCLRDVWGAHVLFTGDDVTGLIDYGAVRDDCVAADLARLLGDLVGDDDGRFAAGLAAYRAAGGAPDVPDGLVRLLDRTGVVCGVVNWLSRLREGGYDRPDAPAVAGRLDRLAARIERW
jgi:hypothetical protein